MIILLQYFRFNTLVLHGLHCRVHQSSTELEHNQNSQKRLRQSINSLQNTVAKLEEQERQLRIENSNVHLKFKAQLNEVKYFYKIFQVELFIYMKR